MSSKERNPTVEIEKEIYEKLKDLSFDNRRKLKPFVNDILLDFVNKGKTTNTKEEKDRISELEEKMKNMIKQNEYSQKVIEHTSDGMMEFVRTIFPSELKKMPISQEFNKIGNLIGKSATDKQMIILDELLKKEISVKVKGNTLTCLHHKSHSCEHVEYALSHVPFFFNLILNKVKIPQKELLMKKLEEMEPTK